MFKMSKINIYFYRNLKNFFKCWFVKIQSLGPLQGLISNSDFEALTTTFNSIYFSRFCIVFQASQITLGQQPLIHFYNYIIFTTFLYFRRVVLGGEWGVAALNKQC